MKALRTSRLASDEWAPAVNPDRFGEISEMARLFRNRVSKRHGLTGSMIQEGHVRADTANRTSARAVGLPVGTAQGRQVDAAAPPVPRSSLPRPPRHAADAPADARAVAAVRPDSRSRACRRGTSRDPRRSAKGSRSPGRSPPLDRERRTQLRVMRVQRKETEAGPIKPSRRGARGD